MCWNTRWSRLRIGGLIIFVCSALEAQAALVTLAWDPSSAPNIAGYRLHSGTTSSVYSQTIDVGNATTALVSNLVTGKTYFFVVTAYDTMGVESAPSSEVAYCVPSSSATPTPTPSATPTPSSTPKPTPTPTPSPTPKASATPTPTPKPTATPTATPPPIPTVMVSPLPGSTFTSSKVTFQWTAGSATAYGLTVGSSPGGVDIYASTTLQTLSQTVTKIPTDGRTVYVRLYSQVNGTWKSNSYTYKAF